MIVDPEIQPIRFLRDGDSEWGADPHVQGFLRRLNRQVDADHARERDQNARRAQIEKQSPALAAVMGRQSPESEFEYAVLNQKLVGFIGDEPIVKRYVNYLDAASANGHSNTEWWHAFGHQQIAALTFLVAETRDQVEAARYTGPAMPVAWDVRLFPHDPADSYIDFGPQEAGFEWAGRTLDAQCHLWHDDMLEAALAAPLVPHEVQPNALPFDGVFFSFEKAAWFEASEPAIDQDTQEAVSATAETWWVLISKMGDAGMMIVFNKQIYPTGKFQPQEHLICEPIGWGQKWPEDFTHRRFGPEIANVLRMLAFMQAPFVDAVPQQRHLPRPIRREYDRQGAPVPDKQVSIVTLRRSLHEPLYEAPQEGEDGPVRRFNHSWWVAGHYRWQYYPSEKTHRLIAISPFMKQKGKPLLKKLYDIKQ